MPILDGPKIPWTTLTLKAPGALWQARVECHHALQVVGAVGHSFLSPTPDDSHTALGWIPEFRAFASGALPGSGGKVALCAGDLEVLILSDGFEILDRTMALGMTSEALFAWVGAALKTHFGCDPAKLVAREYDLPTRADGPFAVDDPKDLQQLSRYYDNAHSVLTRVARTVEGAGDVLTWPHHMDMAVLVTLQAPSEPGGEDGRSLGVGMTPGDGSHRDPYFYLLPWPAPEPKVLPALRGPGRWQKEGWVGGILPMGVDFTAQGDDEELEAVTAFLKTAIPLLRGVVSGE